MKTTIRLPRKVTLMDLIWFVGVFCIASYALLEAASISLSAFSFLKKPFLYAGGLCIGLQANLLIYYVVKRKYMAVVLNVLLWCILLGCSLLVDRDYVLQTSPRMATLRLILYLAELFALMMLIAQAGRGEATIRFLYWYLLILVFLTDVVLFTRVAVFYSGGFETYLVGTKFSVVYLHMDLVAIWLMRNRHELKSSKKRPKLKLAVMLLISAIVSLKVDCKTGVLGCIMLLALLAFIESPKSKRGHLLTSPAVLFATLLISAILPFVIKEILEIPIVTYLVRDVLKRSLTLTGRTKIYAKYIDAMEGYWRWGYGYGTGNEVSMELFGGYANSQNGLLQWVLQAGIVNAAAMCMLFTIIFWQLSKSQPEKKAYLMPLVALIYVYIVLGVIETTYNMAFIMWFALIFMFVNQKEKRFCSVCQERNRSEV